MVVPSVNPSLKTVIVVLASAVPEIGSDELLVVVPSVGAVITGAAGAPVSTVRAIAVEARLVLFPASVAVAVIEYVASPHGVAVV